MFDLERWQEIFETLSKNKLQTFLTMVSVFSGVLILIILIGFSTGIQNGVRSEFEQDATNRISIRAGITTKEFKGLNPGRRIQLRNEDFAEINRKYEEDIEYKTGIYNIWGGQTTYGKESGNYRIEGAYPDQQFIENASMVTGRFISQDDMDESRKIVVIGNQVKKDLFKDKDPIGESVKIFGINFKVVGVYTDPGGEREETRLFLPLPTAQKVFFGGDRIRSMAYTVKMSDNFDEAVALSAALSENFETDLKSKYSVSPDDRSAFRVNNTLEEARKIYSLIDTISAVFWFIGLGTIIAGVVGVGNIMLIVVKERTKEIGVRKALGALPSSIVGMILQEAIFITAIAGFSGLFLGVIALNIASPLIDSDFIKFPRVDFATSITIVLIIIFAGALAGYFPARRAAHIKPIEALRDE
ncbi:MAG: ABC transporter permease [Dokdonia sp.]|jgi:putative ABC transport system permease protein|nr:ABC transporter ATP-binding protein [Cytophagaceae bacterium]